MKNVSLKLPEVLDARLQKAARTRGWTKSEVVRRAVARYLPAEEPQDKSSFLARAGDLIGCVDGPADLSLNPRHLHGYGE